MFKVLVLVSLVGSFYSGVAGAKEVTVDQKDKKFSTKKIKAKLGDTLEFKNSEKDITHNVYSLTPGNSFEIQVQKPGTSTKLKLEKGKFKSGKMKVECAIHPTMQLEVEIE